MLLYVLLALSVVVSLFGMVNALVLTVFERTREIGMMRAVGMTRRQVRRMVRHESIITALIGAGLGLPLGAAGRRRRWRAPCSTPFVPPVRVAGDLHASSRSSPACSPPIAPARRAVEAERPAGAALRVARPPRAASGGSGDPLRRLATPCLGRWRDVHTDVYTRPPGASLLRRVPVGGGRSRRSSQHAVAAPTSSGAPRRVDRRRRVAGSGPAAPGRRRSAATSRRSTTRGSSTSTTATGRSRSNPARTRSCSSRRRRSRRCAGYITRFHPDLIYTNGKKPAVDVLHLHHGVWQMRENATFAAGRGEDDHAVPARASATATTRATRGC